MEFDFTGSGSEKGPSCLHDLASCGGLLGGTYTLIRDIKESLENLGQNNIFSHFLLDSRPSARAGDNPEIGRLDICDHSEIA